MPFLNFNIKKINNFVLIVFLVSYFLQPISVSAFSTATEANNYTNHQATEKIEKLLVKNQGESTIDPEVAALPNFNNWWIEAQKNIELEEYKPTLQSKDNQGNDLPQNTWHFFNRVNNFRSYINIDGWQVLPKEINEENNWHWKYKTISISRDRDITIDEFSIPNNENIEEKDNTIIIDRGNVKEWYKNSKFGIKQGYTIEEKPSGKGLLRLTARINTNLLVNSFSDEQITFSNGKKDVLKLDNLIVYDVYNQKIPAKFKYNKQESTITIEIDDTQAIYPITIDPLSSSPDWTAEADQANAYFGASVASAGDVN